MSLLDQTIERREAAQADLDAFIKTASDDSRDFTADEETSFRAKAEEVKKHDERIAELRDLDARSEAAKASASKFATGVTVAEPEVYRQGGSVSYFRDLYRAEQYRDADSLDRLTRNAKRTQDEMSKRALNTTAGTGGTFDPPLWMIDNFIAALRPARPLADVVTKGNLPSGVASINVPRISTGTSVATQSTQNAALSNTDPTTSTVTAPVQTAGGYLVVSQQEIDQSPLNMDDLWLGDLAADYARAIDVAVINAVVAGGVAQTYTDASPTSAKVNGQIAQGIAAVHSGRYAPPTYAVMHPVRWGKFLSYTDSTGRPLVVPNPAYTPTNAFGEGTEVKSQGIAGTIQGVPVLLDASIPQNLGGSTNQDVVILIKADDLVLWEGTPRAEAMPQTFGQNLSVVLRFFSYYALALRLAQSAVVVGGTGMATTLAFGS